MKKTRWVFGGLFGKEGGAKLPRLAEFGEIPSFWSILQLRNVSESKGIFLEACTLKKNACGALGQLWTVLNTFADPSERYDGLISRVGTPRRTCSALAWLDKSSTHKIIVTLLTRWSPPGHNCNVSRNRDWNSEVFTVRIFSRKNEFLRRWNSIDSLQINLAWARTKKRSRSERNIVGKMANGRKNNTKMPSTGRVLWRNYVNKNIFSTTKKLGETKKTRWVLGEGKKLGEQN